MLDSIRHRKLREEKKEVDSGGTPPPPADSKTPPPNTPPPEGEGDLDEFGYKKSKAEGDPDKSGKEKDPPKKEEIKIDTPVSGYEKEPVKVEDLPPKKDEPPAAPDEIDKVLEGSHADDVKELKALAVKGKFTPEQTKELVAARIAERQAATAFVENQKKEREQQTLRTRAGWHKELKEDKDFGGEHFDQNLLQVERVVQDHLPNFKKELTRSGQMLPPYLMRDLASLAKTLYATDKIVHGDPPKKEDMAPPKSPLDEALEFYQ